MKEWPLIVFTLLSQMATGAFLTFDGLPIGLQLVHSLDFDF